FSILGCGYPLGAAGPIITEKKCVEKTWPSWWDTLENTLQVKTVGVDLDVHDEPHSVSDKATRIDPAKSIVLIGMRGAGKTHMGRAGAAHLKRTFVDMDLYLEAQAKCTIPEFLKQNSWEAFRALEVECLQKVLDDHPTGHLIACGGGIVEGAVAREILSKWSGLVVHIKRDIGSVEAYLNIDKTRPMYGEDMRSVWKRRQPWYTACSNAEFVVLSPEDAASAPADHYESVEKDFGRFLDFKLAAQPFPFPAGALSFFVSLTDPNVRTTIPILDEISVGANALELRVDLLESYSCDFVGEQVALLRSASPLPIVFTVRTAMQGGRFSNDAHDEMLVLLEAGMRWGCEYIDVEFTPPFHRFLPLIHAKGNSRIIASYHDVQGKDSWGRGGSMEAKYRDLHPLCDVVKLIGRASQFEDNFALYKFTSEVVPGLGL
ncbi:3-dehydroquinate dehydratase (3-dehydroquinase), partial [Kappamyces sp. JEL0680]